MPTLTPDGNAVDNTNQKIEQLELEQANLMNNIYMTTCQLDIFTTQLNTMSD
jgi:hypothetical protein